MLIFKAFNIFSDCVLTHLQSFSNCSVAGIALICFSDFNKSNSKNFEKINCQMKSFGYKVLKDENKKPILCEQILFSDLQSFLFYDFFNGIRNNYIPNKCKHCGKFFLIRGGKYFSYCDNPLKDEPDKTCRDVGWQSIKFCVNNNLSSNNRIVDCDAIRLFDLPRVNFLFLSVECYARLA